MKEDEQNNMEGGGVKYLKSGTASEKSEGTQFSLDFYWVKNRNFLFSANNKVAHFRQARVSVIL